MSPPTQTLDRPRKQDGEPNKQQAERESGRSDAVREYRVSSGFANECKEKEGWMIKSERAGRKLPKTKLPLPWTTGTLAPLTTMEYGAITS